MNVFVGFYEGILRQILGILSIVHHRIQKAENLLIEPANQPPRRIPGNPFGIAEPILPR